MHQEIEDAIRFKLGDYMDSETDDLDRNDFLEIIRELKRQIFQVFQEAGMCNSLLIVHKSGQRFPYLHCITSFWHEDKYNN